MRLLSPKNPTSKLGTMYQINNKSYIDKCILSFSHNRLSSRAEADRLSLEKAEREIAAGKRGVSHLILRAEDDSIDRVKFLFLISGIPLMCYALANVLNSTLKDVVVIGSEEVRYVLDAYLNIVGDGGKNVSFVEEEKKRLSIGRTMNQGREVLQPGPGELVLFQPGDLPFLYDIEKVLQDKGIKNHNLILWLNARKRMFPNVEKDPDSEFVQRNYHYRTIDVEANELLDLKEPNIYPINFSAVEPDIIELLHDTRKDGKIFFAGINKALKHPKRFLRLLPVLTHQALNFRSDLERFRKEDSFQFGMHKDRFDHAASILLNTSFVSRLHNDPAFVADVDALEDWEDYEELTNYAQIQNGEEGLAEIHPWASSLLMFREKAMPELRTKIPMYANFPEYMNYLYGSMKMRSSPFDNWGIYRQLENHGKKNQAAFQWYRDKTRQFLQNA